MWTLLREVSFRHLIRSPARTALVIFGIALGVCMLSAMLATNDTLSAAFEDMVDRVAGQADLTVVGSEAGIPSSLTGEIADLPGVEHAAAMLEVVTHVAKPGGQTILVLGVDLLGDTFFLPFAQEGEGKVIEDPLAFVNDPTAILVSRKLAERQQLKVGDPLPLLTSEGEKTFHVRGLLEDKGPAASYGGQVVVMFIDAAQVSFSRGYAVDRIDVVASEGAQVADVRARIEQQLAGRARVDEPEGRTRRLVASFDTFRNGLNLSALIALGVSTFLIYNAVSVSVAQRRREVGILRALGVVRGRMVRLFCLEALVMAAIGVTVGLLFAQPLARYALASISATISRMSVLAIQPRVPEITREVALWSAFAGVCTTLLASYMPARSTNKVDPAEALRATRSTSQPALRAWGKLGLAGALVALCAPILMQGRSETTGYFATLAVMVGLSMIAPVAVKGLRRLLLKPVERGFGIPGRIALDNVERTLARSTTTVIALMLAIALSMTVGAYAVSFDRSLSQWIDDAFPSDLMVTAGSPTLDRNHIAFAPSLSDKLEGVEGIAAFSRLRAIFAEVGNKRAALHAVDSRVQFSQARLRGRGRRVLSGPETIADDALEAAPRVLISENLAHFSGLDVGSQITLATPSGRRPFEVHAVVVDYSSDQGWLLIDRKWYAQYWNDEPIDALDVYLAEGADKERVAEQMRARLGESANIFVTSHETIRDELRSLAQSLFAYAKAPELITLVVAIMGVIGTMLAAVIDRVREIGMLRAIGATRRQIASSMVAEAGFIGLSAAVCGVLTGVPQGYIFMHVIGTSANGWNLPYGFPAETALRISLVVVTAAALAGYLPGRRAAAMDVKEALSYE